MSICQLHKIGYKSYLVWKERALNKLGAGPGANVIMLRRVVYSLQHNLEGSCVVCDHDEHLVSAGLRISLSQLHHPREVLIMTP